MSDDFARLMVGAPIKLTGGRNRYMVTTGKRVRTFQLYARIPTAARSSARHFPGDWMPEWDFRSRCWVRVTELIPLEVRNHVGRNTDGHLGFERKLLEHLEDRFALDFARKHNDSQWWIRGNRCFWKPEILDEVIRALVSELLLETSLVPPEAP